MDKYLGLPTQACIGMCVSKTLSVQAGFKAGKGLYLPGLAGIKSVPGTDMRYFQSCMSLEKLFFDAQFSDITHRLKAGIEPREYFPAADLSDKLLREITLLAVEHMLRYFR